MRARLASHIAVVGCCEEWGFERLHPFPSVDIFSCIFFLNLVRLSCGLLNTRFVRCHNNYFGAKFGTLLRILSEDNYVGSRSSFFFYFFLLSWIDTYWRSIRFNPTDITCYQSHPLRSVQVPWKMFFERLLWRVTCPNQARFRPLTVSRCVRDRGKGGGGGDGGQRRSVYKRLYEKTSTRIWHTWERYLTSKMIQFST